MLKNSKKLISIILAVLMVLSLSVPAFGVYEEYPTIYVTGAQTNKIYSADGEHISDFSIDIKGMIGNDGKALITDFVIGMISDNYKEFADKIHKIIIDAYGKSALDKNGEASNGSHPEKH